APVAALGVGVVDLFDHAVQLAVGPALLAALGRALVGAVGLLVELPRGGVALAGELLLGLVPQPRRGRGQGRRGGGRGATRPQAGAEGVRLQRLAGGGERARAGRRAGGAARSGADTTGQRGGDGGGRGRAGRGRERRRGWRLGRFGEAVGVEDA